MYSRILVPLDGSELAEGVLPYLRNIASGLRSPLELLQVVSVSGAAGWPAQHRPGPPRQVDDPKAQAIAYLNQVRASLADLEVPVACAVSEGDPVAQISRDAQRDTATLIALATHGRSGITRWALGSVTDRLLQSVTLPVLVVRARGGPDSNQKARFNRIVVPLDGSPLAEQVLPHVVPWTNALGLEVILVSVAVPAARASAGDYLSGVQEQLRCHGIAAAAEVVGHDSPALGIIEFAQERGDCLIAMSSHGRSGMGRWVLGSVTDRVIRHSGQPVLVHRPHQARPVNLLPQLA